MAHFIQAAVATLVFGIPGIYAGQITQTFKFGPAPADINSGQSQGTFNYFGVYNLAGAILNSVTIDVMINETVLGLGINNNEPKNLTYSTASQFSFAGTIPDAINLNALLSGLASIGLGTSVTRAPQTTGSKTATTGLYTSPQTNAYLGSGTFTLGYSTVTGQTFVGTAHHPVSQTVISSDLVSIVYNYSNGSTVPEPATMTLLGSALIGLGIYGRKRSKKKG